MLDFTEDYIKKNKEQIEQNKCISIGDLGCADALNDVPMIIQLIEKFRAAFPMIPVFVFLNDLPS